MAFVDESGNVGEVASGGNLTFTLACILMPAAEWLPTFDQVIAFRRWVRARFGVPVRVELKASYLIGNRGPYFSKNPLPEDMRRTIYRQAMRLHPKIGLQTFGVVIDKTKLEVQKPGVSPRDVAWEYLLQRLERISNNPPLGPTDVLLVHDAGEAAVARRLARKARRHGTAGSRFGTGALDVPFQRLIDDPVPRDSRQSYFVQLADLAAYAAFRRFFPPPTATASIVPQTMWDELGDARYLPVTGANRFGIVKYPR